MSQIVLVEALFSFAASVLVLAGNFSSFVIYDASSPRIIKIIILEVSYS
jgi:hypothetical protein